MPCGYRTVNGNTLQGTLAGSALLYDLSPDCEHAGRQMSCRPIRKHERLPVLYSQAVCVHVHLPQPVRVQMLARAAILSVQCATACVQAWHHWSASCLLPSGATRYLPCWQQQRFICQNALAFAPLALSHSKWLLSSSALRADVDFLPAQGLNWRLFWTVCSMVSCHVTGIHIARTAWQESK